MTVLPFVLLLLPFADSADSEDQAHLSHRLGLLIEGYQSQAKRQSPKAIAIRSGVLREVAHLPWTGPAKEEVANFLAQVVAEDRAFLVRAEAIRCIGRVGTPQALDSLYRSVFGKRGRSPRYALLDSLIPRALRHLPDKRDWRWIEERILAPRDSSSYLGMAGHRAEEMIAFTIEAIGHGAVRSAVPTVRRFADSVDPAVRAAAIRALGRLHAAPDLVTAALKDPDEYVRMAAASGESLPWTQLRSLLENPSTVMRRKAIRNLDARSPELALPNLVQRLRLDPSYAVRVDVHGMLTRRTGRDFGMDGELWSSWLKARSGKPGRAVSGGGEDGAGTAASTKRPGRPVLFLVDVSASMNRVAARGRTRQQQATEAVRKYIGEMERSARYAVIAFASENRRYPKRVIAAKRPADVLLWLGSLKPAGASNSYAALMDAIRDTLHPMTIVYVTDGVPRHSSWRGKTYNYPEQILYEVRQANRKRMVQIDTIGLIGGSPRGDEPLDEAGAEAYLRRIAADNGGTYREVR